MNKLKLVVLFLLASLIFGCGGGKNKSPVNQIVADTDGDTIPDDMDNCPMSANTSQIDVDQDSIGDACDSLVDSDRDTIPDDMDNCPMSANTSQVDVDQDSIGDACDPLVDSDGDGFADNIDNCPLFPNNQLDDDGDGKGNPCDDETFIDNDNDGVNDAEDNCISLYNPEQKDNDNDNQGDDCDRTPNGPDADGDGVGEVVDNCPFVKNPEQLDADNNGLGDLCDDGAFGDLDGDSINNARDVDFTGGADVNLNGVDDLTEPTEVDSDFDGIVDAEDNCVATSNPAQLDSNGDNIGDACRVELLGACGAEAGSDAGNKGFTSREWDDNCNLNADGEWQQSGYVLGVQTLLLCIGFSLDVDGIFGPETREVVEAFQADEGIQISGEVDAPTWTALRNQLNRVSDNGRFIRYSIGTCDVNEFAFDWDRASENKEWELRTDDIIGFSGSSRWFKFSTAPVSFLEF